MTFGDYGMAVLGFGLLFGGSIGALFFGACGMFNKPRDKSNLLTSAISLMYCIFAYIGLHMIAPYWPVIKDAIRNFN